MSTGIVHMQVYAEPQAIYCCICEESESLEMAEASGLEIAGSANDKLEVSRLLQVDPTL